MRITPLDVRKQEFNKSMRGFDCDEVKAFLHTLADEYEAVLMDNKEIRERVMDQDDKIAEYNDLEKTLRDTLMTAERVMQDTRETASQKGDLIIREAELKAKSILEECRVRTEELRREIVGLRKEKETYLGRFRSLAQAQIQFIDTHENDFEELDKRLLDIVDNVAVKVISGADMASNSSKGLGTSTSTSTSQQSFPEANVPTASVDHGPTVAPAPTPAPVSSETDIWRDYATGSESSDVAASATEEFSAASSDQNSHDQSNHDNDAKIADILTESLVEAETDQAAEMVDFITSDVVAVPEETEEAHEPLSI